MTRRPCLVLPLLAVMAACQEAESRQGGDPEPGDPVGGGPARFRLVNESPAPVYLQVVPGVPWALLRGGQYLSANTATLCICPDTDCPMVGPVALRGEVAALDPGRSYSWDWDGRIWKAVQRDGKACRRSELLAPGPVTVMVGHGSQFRDLGIGGAHVEAPITETSVDFQHEAGVQVEVVIR